MAHRDDPGGVTVGELGREAVAESLPRALRALGACAVIALAVNAWLHPEPLPLVAEREYEVLVPCPESGGEAAPLDAADARLTSSATYVVDARAAARYSAWHLPGSRSIPYDYLEPTPPDTLCDLAQSIARSRARQVVVYGDGDAPDTGQLLAREISGHGIRNVFYVRGGAPALSASTGGGTGTEHETRAGAP